MYWTTRYMYSTNAMMGKVLDITFISYIVYNLYASLKRT